MATKRKKPSKPRGRWVTKHPHSNLPLYKVLGKAGNAINGGKFSYGKDPVGRVVEIAEDDLPIALCERGFHLTTRPTNWSGFQTETRTFRAAFWLPAGEVAHLATFRILDRPKEAYCLYEAANDKIVCRKIKILDEFHPRVTKKLVLPTVRIRKGKNGDITSVTVNDGTPPQVEWTTKGVTADAAKNMKKKYNDGVRALGRQLRKLSNDIEKRLLAAERQAVRLEHQLNKVEEALDEVGCLSV